MVEPSTVSLPQRYRDVSYWLDDLDDDPLLPRLPLAGDRDVDVAIVGAGFTGLWTAYYLARADPSLRIAIVEAEIAGFGASGRNGGWCSALVPMSMARLSAEVGRDGAVAFARELQVTVGEVGRVAEAEGIDCHFQHGGTLTLATRAAHLDALGEELREARRWGFGPDDLRWLEGDEVRQRVLVEGAIAGLFTPHCAALHPGRLVRGLAAVVEAAGVAVHERCPALSLAPGAVVTRTGVLRAEVVVRATEAYTPRLAGHGRDLAVLWSYLVVTEPLPALTWKRLGWEGRETLSDGHHSLIYAQRTADGRIALGGRGAPAPFRSRTGPSLERRPTIYRRLVDTLHRRFPATSDARVTHHWGGPLGVSRDWYTSVGFDRSTGMAWANGYVGDGVGASNLAGRTLADLVTGRDSDLVRHPWVGHRSPRWELEPVRWAAVNAALRLPFVADAIEARTGRPARRTVGLLGRLLRNS
jgi:glycine/D-amino acid oxidase-like deaminating enzyme